MELPKAEIVKAVSSKESLLPAAGALGGVFGEAYLEKLAFTGLRSTFGSAELVGGAVKVYPVDSKGIKGANPDQGLFVRRQLARGGLVALGLIGVALARNPVLKGLALGTAATAGAHIAQDFFPSTVAPR